MRQSLQSLIGYSIKATDGELGKVTDFYFDDESWILRYLIVETGNWLVGRTVLISLAALNKPDWKSHTFSVNLTCDQVRNSPDIDTERPVYRQHEEELHRHYVWAPYWQSSFSGALGVTPYPLYEVPGTEELPESTKEEDRHLRSAHQITGYKIHATDGEMGHVEDFILDDENWMLRYLVVKTGNWFTGKNVIISHTWIQGVHWADSSIHVDRTLEFIKNSPDVDILKI